MKTFYEMMAQRKNPPKPVTKKTPRRSLARTQSEAVLPFLKNSLSSGASLFQAPLREAKNRLTLSNHLPAKSDQSEEGAKQHSESLSLEKNLPVLERSHSEKIEPSLISATLTASPSRRSKFFPFLFGTSDSHFRKDLKSNLKDGYEWTNSLAELTVKIENALEILGVTYYFESY
jgi:hypothetical protein